MPSKFFEVTSEQEIVDYSKATLLWSRVPYSEEMARAGGVPSMQLARAMVRLGVKYYVLVEED